MSDMDDRNQELFKFRLGLLETNYANILKLVQETHDAVTTMKAKMGENPFQCSLHSERLSAFEKRMIDLEASRDARNKEVEDQKKFIYKIMGGLSVVVLILSIFVGPMVVNWIGSSSNKVEPNKVHSHSMVIPGSTNVITLHDIP